MIKTIARELRSHAPFTLLGAVGGIIVAVVFIYTGVPKHVSEKLFWTFHPAHVLFSAFVTTAMYRRHGKRGIIATLIIGYVGSVGIGTMSDSLIPYLGEWLLGISDAHVHGHAHIGFIEMWWLVNPMAIIGILLGMLLLKTKFPHAVHVLLSTAASLFHILMAVHGEVSPLTLAIIPVILFIAVWAPCCTSDIVFPLLFTGKAPPCSCGHKHE